MADSRMQVVLLGRSRDLSGRYLVVALGLFGTTLGGMALLQFIDRQNASVPIEVYWLMLATTLLMVGVPAVQAYRNGGLLVSWVLGTAIPFALYADLLPYHLGGGIGAPQGGVRAALLYGIPAGTLGFLLGTGVRRGWRWLRSRFGGA